MRARKKKKIKLISKVYIIIILIITLTYFFIAHYLKNINPKVINVSEEMINKIYEEFLSDNIGYDLLADVSFDDILDINKNKEGEILNVDFNLKYAYQVLDLITDDITSDIKNLENGRINLNNPYVFNYQNGLILKLPLFIASKYALLSNLGPSIYLKVNFIGSVLTNVKTKITNYGLNNALVELYVSLELSSELISPVTKKNEKISYDVLIASKIINGRVPELYGDSLIRESSIIESKLN